MNVYRNLKRCILNNVRWSSPAAYYFLILKNSFMNSLLFKVTFEVLYRIYPNRSPGVYFLQMIFDPACKRVRRLFKPWHLFPIVHLSRVKWQVLVPVFTSLIIWLDANTFIKVHGLHSLIKRVSASCGKTTNMINML